MRQIIGANENELKRVYGDDHQFTKHSCQLPYAWTPAVLEARQEALIALLAKEWRLTPGLAG